MDKEQFRHLLQRYQAGLASQQEKAFVEAYYAAFERKPDVIEQLSPAEQVRLEEILYEDLLKEAPISNRRSWSKLLKVNFLRYAAACILLLAGVTALLYNHRSQFKMVPQNAIGKPDILPGGNRAILTLSDGSTIMLDSAANGALAQQGNMRLMKQANGQVRYESLGQIRQGKVSLIAYNTVNTPKGGQYQVILPDGSRVWLNAASSIRFPTSFDQERKVSITGEVYFEIVADKTRPFRVSANGTDVEVLGTSFNINAYADEQFTSTTLLEGGVRVSYRGRSGAGAKSVVLRSGQQAEVDDKIQVREDVNIEQVIAWKNGVFDFQDATLEEVMRQLARWYDLEVVYDKEVPHQEFYGSMERNLPLSKVLNGLKMSKVHFSVEGKKLIVRP